MEAMDERKLSLYHRLVPKLDEELARDLVLALPPDPNQLVTKDFLSDQLMVYEARIVDRLTWRMITVMGAWTAIGVSLFALMSQLFR